MQAVPIHVGTYPGSAINSLHISMHLFRTWPLVKPCLSFIPVATHSSIRFSSVMSLGDLFLALVLQHHDCVHKYLCRAGF